MKEIAVRSSSVPIVKEPQLVEHLHDKTLHHATTDAPGSGAFRLGSDGFPVLFFRFFMGTGSIFLMLSIVFSGLGYSDLAQYCFSQLNTCVAMAVGVRLLLELIIRM
ncbi:hypothetical protein BDR26DRAFT_860418 [Obelidium mucronatum]|nr:hypothetical protein BDR26DRAFT_860418 [Obelidium mucronatum]